MTMRNKRTIAGVALVASILLVTATSAWANNSERDASGRALHWNRSGTALAQVYFIDHTSARWPVNASTVTWNQSTRVKSYYNWSTCPGTSLHCVHVTEYNSADGNYGYTSLAWDSNAHFTSAHVYLNDHYNPGSYDDRQTVCQEEGHALGLDHQYTNDTCMNDTTHNVRFPNTHDFNQLAAVYDH